MLLRLGLFILLLTPFVDLYLLLEVSSIIGFWRTLGIIILTGLIGAEIVRREGIHVLLKLQSSVTMGETTRNLLEAGLLVISGLFLITPGLITDLAGFLLVIRPLRERLVARISENDYFENMNVEVHTF